MKRLFDFIASLFGLIIFSPILIPIMILVWVQDFHSPFYVAPRIGKDGNIFKMVKLRSMIKNADKSGVDSTAASDMRITKIGYYIRRFKLDELTQLWNVFIGDMSLVGPRPNVKRETELYTVEEKKLLSVKPGITDFSSIVFSDEGEILKDKEDPDIAYHQLIRPGKSELGIFYINNKSFWLDILLCIITIITIFSRNLALQIINSLLKKLGASEMLVELALRNKPLSAMPPPGSNFIVTSRDI